ncbi:hypothetical protein KVF89_11685 [Nocardioides carbamazepini]|jgi:hypothetical protein|uniref:hypothetical protein n=1 Tax=Nocardioides carbamazepini TaxID=2854259 RepID=UPI00214A62A8|nr:hypothetical protein [Nocardioides carbamazepini]MCR1783196.1 hypothetical protein [Nocardioides carbamazepini]
MQISAARAVLVGTAAVLVTTTAVIVGVLLRPAPGQPGTPPAGPVSVLAPAAGRIDVARAVGSLAVLRDWDRARSRAWEEADPAALRGLYAPGAAAGARDVAMLRAWLRRGLRVEGMAMQVLAVELRRRTDHRIVLVVTDRLAGAVGVRSLSGERTALPRDGPTTRRLEFVRDGSRWLLASAQEAEPRRPVASTAATSGSAKP